MSGKPQFNWWPLIHQTSRRTFPDYTS